GHVPRRVLGSVGVPAYVGDVAGGEPVHDEITEGGGVLTAPGPKRPGPFGGEFTLGEHGPLVPADLVNGDVRLLRDLRRGSTGADERLNVRGAERWGPQLFPLWPITPVSCPEGFGDGELITLIGGIYQHEALAGDGDSHKFALDHIRVFPPCLLPDHLPL